MDLYGIRLRSTSSKNLTNMGPGGEGWRALGTRLPGAFLSSLYTDTRYEIFYGIQPYLTSTVYIVIDSVKTSS